MENRENVRKNVQPLVLKKPRPLIFSVIFFFKLCRKIEKIEPRPTAAYFIKKRLFKL